MNSIESVHTFSFPQLPKIAWIIALSIHNERPHILLAKRLQNSVHRRTLPGGKVGPGESPIHAAQRELFEETGIASALEVIEAGKQPPQHLWVGGEELIAYGFLLHLYDRDLTEPIVSREPEKLSDWQWVSMQDVVSLILHGLLPRVVIESPWFRQLYISESKVLPRRHRFPFHEE